MEQIRRTPPRGGSGRSADCLVLLAVLIGLVALLILVLLARPGVGLRELVPDGSIAVWIWTFAIGAVVGAAELISRYRDNPGAASLSRPGLLFIVLNGLAAVLTLFLIRHFELAGVKRDDADPDLVKQALLAGTGAMVIIRSKLFTIRQPGGNDVSFGPAFAVDTFLSSINREVDRRRVPDRNKRVAERANELGKYQFKLAAPFLTSALAAFQDMDEDDAKRLRDEYIALEKDQNFAAYTDEVKFYLVGFDILTVFGEKAFDSMFDSLTKYMESQAREPRH
jgi:hypothetical protein